MWKENATSIWSLFLLLNDWRNETIKEVPFECRCKRVWKSLIVSTRWMYDAIWFFILIASTQSYKNWVFNKMTKKWRNELINYDSADLFFVEGNFWEKNNYFSKKNTYLDFFNRVCCYYIIICITWPSWDVFLLMLYRRLKHNCYYEPNDLNCVFRSHNKLSETH